MIQGALEINLESGNKDNLGSKENRAKFLRERAARDPPMQSLINLANLAIEKDSAFYMTCTIHVKKVWSFTQVQVVVMFVWWLPSLIEAISWAFTKYSQK